MNPSVLFTLVAVSAVANAGFATSDSLPARKPADGTEFSIPEVYLTREPAPAANYRPVVLMHGLGDSGNASGMQSLVKSVMNAFPGAYATSPDVADGTSSYFTLMQDQVDQFAKTVRSDPKLQNGFNAVGISQGGVIVRAYIELYNDPPVYNFVSLCGPQQGVGACPASVPGWICSIFQSNPYPAKLSFAGYWKGSDQATYLKESTFLAGIENARDAKNATYKANMASLNRLALVMALNDTVVYPKESEQFGFYAWGGSKDIVQFKDTDTYKNDWIGLRTLDEAGKIDMLQFEGAHVQFSNQFWNDHILPYFNNTL